MGWITTVTVMVVAADDSADHGPRAEGARESSVTKPVAALFVAVALLSACGTRSAAGTRSTPTTSVAPTVATAQQVIDEFRRSGLPVDGEADTTGKDCATVDCVQAVSTSTVLVRSFRTPGQAETYGQGTGAFQIVTVVLTFTGSATPQQQHRYEAAAARVVH